ncbi:hypothetical protein RRG08_057020 [Elysia crispata]|uniref:Uncharacterized protein n=1 Tax=Elysia crispata TaxID=231223 RepID=A0AAE0Z6C1_9GAST|nr:hypothetical protein RRG08_057020 [Elysia crispata]
MAAYPGRPATREEVRVADLPACDPFDDWSNLKLLGRKPLRAALCKSPWRLWRNIADFVSRNSQLNPGTPSLGVSSFIDFSHRSDDVICPITDRSWSHPVEIEGRRRKHFVWIDETK